MKELVFFLEEASAREMLKGILPRLGYRGASRYVVFDGKKDLEKQLPGKLKGYLNTAATFIVMRDQDRTPDCRTVKKSLVQLCARAGKPHAVVRIACRELEAFYLGDLKAVELGLGVRGLSAKQHKVKYRESDAVDQPSKELAHLTGGLYSKVAGSRAIAPHLDLDHPRSPSFRNLVRSIRRAIA